MPDAYFRAREQLLALQDRLGAFNRFAPAERERLRDLRRQVHRLFQQGKFDEVLAALDAHAREVARLERRS
jgi:hypothetical protein